jgi:branched-chain amino acid transport system ATP-binding protein
MNPPLLQVSALDVFYGRVHALKEISLDVHSGEIVAIIGANGAGKTTLLRALSGLVSASSGRILLEGQDITHRAAHLIAAGGLAHVPEGRMVVGKMTVHENLLIGAHCRSDEHAVRTDLEEMLTTFPILRERLDQPASTLSGGQQQMLVLARALMARPKLLMLDEPSLGLAPIIVMQVFDILRALRSRGITMLLVEQNARQALKLSDRAYVLEPGRIVASGPSAELANDPRIIRAYLGG